MSKFVKGLVGGLAFTQIGPGSTKKADAIRALQEQQGRRQQEGGQALALQAAGQQQAQVDQGLGKARRSVRGRRLLLGDSTGKETVG
jgi:hypothetical protein